MNALWTQFRRLVASVMLVAVTSFVVHGGAMAGLHRHGPGSTECATAASAGHLHQAAAHHADPAAHDHGDGHTHHHADADHAHADATDDDGPEKQQAAGDSCCASVCSVALTAFAPAPVSAPMAVAAARLPVSQDGASSRPEGLKRPPRTPGIA